MTNRKLIDTPLNLWVKSLTNEQRKTFFAAYYNNNMLFPADMDNDLKRRRLNNYRYVSVQKGPGHSEKIAIFISALSVDETLKITTLFPDMQANWVYDLIPKLIALLLANSEFINSKLTFETIVTIIENQRHAQQSDSLHTHSEDQYSRSGSKSGRNRKNAVQYNP